MNVPPGGSLDPEVLLCQRLDPDSRDPYKETHRELDRQLLPRVLGHTGGNQQRAARVLGITRRTLRAKLQKIGLHVAHSLEGNEEGKFIASQMNLAGVFVDKGPPAAA